MSSMTFALNYTAVLMAPDGTEFVFTGSQIIPNTNPQTADLQTSATAMGADISAQMTTGPNAYPVQAATDGDSGGQQA